MWYICTQVNVWAYLLFFSGWEILFFGTHCGRKGITDRIFPGTFKSDLELYEWLSYYKRNKTGSTTSRIRPHTYHAIQRKVSICVCHQTPMYGYSNKVMVTVHHERVINYKFLISRSTSVCVFRLSQWSTVVFFDFSLALN